MIVSQLKWQTQRGREEGPGAQPGSTLPCQTPTGFLDESLSAKGNA